MLYFFALPMRTRALESLASVRIRLSSERPPC